MPGPDERAVQPVAFLGMSGGAGAVVARAITGIPAAPLGGCRINAAARTSG